MLFIMGLLKVFWLLLPAFILVRLLNSRKWKGMVGEFRVSRLLRRGLDRQVYHVFSNLLLPTADGGTTQIDHLIISKHGIFVLEVKNMQGRISGGERERFWTQEIGTSSRSFQNPIHQNYKHLKTLHELTGIREVCFVSLIVFADKAALADELPDNVVQDSELVRCIKARRQRLLTAAQTDAVVANIQAVRLRNSFSNQRRHVQHVRAIAAQKAKTPRPCPLCDGPMVLREARQGSTAGRKFWGCARFPDCRGTRNA